MTPKSFRVIVRPRADLDIVEASAWYERQQSGLGVAFVKEVDAVLAVACRNPTQFPCVYSTPEIRRALTHRFPYRVFFVPLADRIVVFRVVHTARADRVWRSAIPTDL